MKTVDLDRMIIETDYFYKKLILSSGIPKRYFNRFDNDTILREQRRLKIEKIYEHLNLK